MYNLPKGSLLVLLCLTLFMIGCVNEKVPVVDESSGIVETPKDYLNSINKDIIPIDIKVDNKTLKSRIACEFTNGSFETGDFTGWNVLTTGFPLFDWSIHTRDSLGDFGLAFAEPQDGSYAAANGFDGSGPMTFEMWQDVLVCSCAKLTWKNRIQWIYRGYGGFASVPRTFEVQLRNPSDNSLIETIYTFSTGTQDESPAGDTGWQTNEVDISSYAGSNVRILFIETIPQSFTGPGQMEYDAIGFVEIDTDGDGCCDSIDPHPNSNQEATIIINGCDSGVPNIFPEDCSTMSDLIADCATSAANHGEFVSCVSALTNSWKEAGLISGRQKGAIQSCAGQSNNLSSAIK